MASNVDLSFCRKNLRENIHQKTDDVKILQFPSFNAPTFIFNRIFIRSDRHAFLSKFAVLGEQCQAVASELVVCVPRPGFPRLLDSLRVVVHRGDFRGRDVTSAGVDQTAAHLR